MYQKILVPLDGSELAESVLPHAKGLAKACGAEIVVLRIAVNAALEYAFNNPGNAQNIIDEKGNEAGAYIKAQAANLRTAGFKCYHILGEGGVAEAILSVADQIHADLIAMSTHGRSGAARLIMGSVADHVVRSSPIPVLLIRPRA